MLRKDPRQELVALVGGLLGVLPVGVELYSQVARVVDVEESALEGLPVEGALARDQVVVLSARDVFDVEVPDAVAEELDGVGDRLADHLAVADVEVPPEARVAEAV